MARHSEKRVSRLIRLSYRWGAALIDVRVLRVYLTRFHGFLIRVSRGRFPGSRDHLLLRTTGRNSGKTRLVPLFYIEDADGYVVVASGGGSDHAPAWWLNLQADSDATVEIRGEVTPVRCAEVSEAERDRLWPKLVELYPPYDDYAERTERHIPVVLLTPTG
jgi:deazaflavin-dependent oxidoreductase (nitroreductase family)